MHLPHYCGCLVKKSNQRSKLKPKKRKPKLPRNGSALPAKMRNGGGPHKNKADKRKNEDHNPDYLNDDSL